MCQVLRAEREGTVQTSCTGALYPPCRALVGTSLDFRSHLQCENTSKTSYQLWLCSLCISTTFYHLVLRFPETYKFTALAAPQRIPLVLATGIS